MWYQLTCGVREARVGGGWNWELEGGRWVYVSGWGSEGGVQLIMYPQCKASGLDCLQGAWSTAVLHFLKGV